MKLEVIKKRSKKNKKVEEANPLKQGLKQLILRVLDAKFPYVEEANPLKQGLKPSISPIYCSFSIVEEANPLKQGLKH